MKHYSEQEWVRYIEGWLDEAARQAYEDHLYFCDECLEVYMNCIQANSARHSIQPLVKDTVFSTQVMKAIRSRNSVSSLVKLMRKPIFQYAVAAAITFALMITGIFQDFTAELNKIQTHTTQVHEASYTEKLMTKTETLLKAIPLQPKQPLTEKGGEGHE